MVTVIDRGPPKQTVCMNCKVLLQYYPTEVKDRRSEDYRDDPLIIHYIHYINCPACGEDTNVHVPLR